jgi:transposase
MLHRSRDLLVRQRTQLINALRAHLAEVGLVAAAGAEGAKTLVAIVTDETNRTDLPGPMRQALLPLVAQLVSLSEQIGMIERAIHAQHRTSEASRRLETVPGIGVIGATAIARPSPIRLHSNQDAILLPGSGSCRASSRPAASSGLVASPSKATDILRILVVGATAVIRHSRAHPEKQPWLTKLLATKPAKVVAVALANKMARIAWAILTRGETYRAPALAAAA